MHVCDRPELLLEGSRFIYYLNKGSLGSIQTEFNRSRATAELVQAVTAYRPDIIYLRWAMYVYPIQRLFRIAPAIVEVNTHDVREHQLLGAAHSLYNRLTRGIILSGAAGHVFATNELKALKDFSRYQKPGAVVTNSVELRATPYYPAPRNIPPHLVFIGTPGMVWHGVDKLVTLATDFPDLVIDIVGIDEIKGCSKFPSNLILHGFLEGAAYESVLANADAAIGTLSLHLKGMEEAATLKIRDCAARGIPCILPYLDSEFLDINSSLFIQIPNTADNIKTHGQAIRDFVFQARGQRVARELISDRIDSRIKESQRLEFFQRILQERHS
jgi:hypothetical protein